MYINFKTDKINLNIRNNSKRLPNKESGLDLWVLGGERKRRGWHNK